MKAIVCGGGIGGLAAAIALRAVGVEVEVYERAPQIREVGAGITLWSNAVKALRALGVADEIVAKGTILGRTTSHRPDGTLVSDMDVGEISERHGAPSVCVHRAELQAALLHALPTSSVFTGRTVIDVKQDDGGAIARFEGGGEARGDVVVGADGIKSNVRDAVLPGAKPKWAGYCAWRGMAKLGTGRARETFVALGAGTQAALFPCGDGRVYWFVTTNAPEGRRDAEGSARAAALATIARWKVVDTFRRAIDATDERAVLRNDIYELPHRKTWSVGRVTLLGDAAHATTPNLGQGACMAIEDGVALAHALRDAKDVPAALRAYEESRRARTTFVVERSHSVGFFFQLENRVAVRLRDWAMSTRSARRSYERMLDELLAWEPPPLKG